MAPSWVVSSAIAFVFAGLGIYFRPRRRQPDAANDPTHVDVANSQDTTNEEAGTVYSCSATTEQSSSSGSVSAVPGHEFEVFLSFRGAEIRKTFLDCLYQNLTDVGVRAFRDNEELRVGKEIGPDLMRAIKQSKISIPIFTRGYATSKWCLREVAEMVECMKDPGCKQHIIPIFLDVTPDEVQHQSGTYAEAFAQHDKKSDPETVQGWRDALKEVVKLKGLELNLAANGNQGEFIKLVVAEVLRELRQASSLGRNEISVGLDDHSAKVMQMLEVGETDVRMVGIWGIGGIGKTTLAKHVNNRIADQFERCSFLSDIRETSGKPGGLLELQRQLVSDILGKDKYDLANTDHGINVFESRLAGKKALIILDDVDHIRQLRALAANLGWFGSGSRILVTTREKGVLDQFPSCKIYEHQLLDEGPALELFRQHAFRDDLRSADEYGDLARDIVSITQRLPLALEVIGSSLFASRGNKEVWHGTIEQLRRKPHMEVQEKLRISYDALEYEEKEIFLDIACFFTGVDCELVTPLWDDCQFLPAYRLEVLQRKSLVKIGDGNRLQMHDQLRDLGRHIVDQESYKEPELRSRLWRSKEAIDVLRGKQGTSKIEAAEIWPPEEEISLSAECFKNLSKLRILQLRGDVEIVGDLQHLLPKLRWLRWSMENMSLPANLPLKNLTVLCLSSSGVNEDWIGWNSIKMERLKVLDLSHCGRLRRSPGFSAFPNLERLILELCDNLVSIDPSIGLLKKLKFLNLRWCWKLKKLPNQLGYLEALTVLIVDKTDVEEIPLSDRMKNLEILSANRCRRLNHIPREIGSLVKLKMLSLEDCGRLRELPDTIGELKSLSELRLRGSGITCLPKTLRNLKELQVMDASGCSSLEGEVPVDIRGLSLVRVLTLRLGDVERSASSLRGLSHLQTLHLYLGRGWSLETLPELPLGLISLTVKGSSTGEKEVDLCGELKEDWLGQLCKLEKLSLRSVNIKDLPESIGSFSCLQEISLSGCAKLEHVPPLPSSLRSLSISDCRSLWKLPSLSNLRKLTGLEVRDCPSTMLNGVERIESLQQLSIKFCDVKRLPDLSNLQRLRRLYASDNIHLVDVQGINKLTKLESVDFSDCTALERLDGVEKLESLKELTLRGCKMIEELPDLSRLQNLTDLFAEGCEKLRHVEGLGELVSLSWLDIRGCKAIEELPHLSKLHNLGSLHAGGCEKLRHVEGLGELVSLSWLDISGCKAIEELPDLSKLQNLTHLWVSRIQNLRQLESIRELGSLEELDISGCTEIVKLPDLSKLQWLRSVNMRDCEKLSGVDEVGELESLESLALSRLKSIEKLPDLSKLRRLSWLEVKSCEKLREIEGLEELESLEHLSISRCKEIEKLLDLSKLHTLYSLRVEVWENSRQLDVLREMNSLRKLDISGSKAIEKLPELSKNYHLSQLYMRDCKKLCQLDGLGELVSLEELDVSCCSAIESLPDLAKLQRLRILKVKACTKLCQLDGLGELRSLEELDISGCTAIGNLPDLSQLERLSKLILKACKNLLQLEGLGGLDSLKELNVSGCKSLEKFLELPRLHSLQDLRMEGCGKLRQLDGLEELESLRILKIGGCRAIEMLPDLSKIQKLRHLDIKGCKKLRQLEGLEELKFLEELNISGCKAIEKLPDSSRLQRLKKLKMEGCRNIRVIQGLEKLSDLSVLCIFGCKLLNLPDLSHLKDLRIRK